MIIQLFSSSKTRNTTITDRCNSLYRGKVTPESQMFRHSWRPAQIDQAGYQVPSLIQFYQFQQVLYISRQNSALTEQSKHKCMGIYHTCTNTITFYYPIPRQGHNLIASTISIGNYRQTEENTDDLPGEPWSANCTRFSCSASFKSENMQTTRCSLIIVHEKNKKNARKPF